VKSWWLRAAGVEEIVHPRWLIRGPGRPLNFTVRHHRSTRRVIANKRRGT
jgi:hypothetical protein